MFNKKMSFVIKNETAQLGIDTESGQLAEAEWLARYVTTDGGGSLVNSVADLVRSGRLQSGARLPTVRALARQLGVSPATVAGAWSRLRELGLIETRRRGGTIAVFEPEASVGHGARGDHEQAWDLAQGLIDHALLPDLTAALMAGLRVKSLNGAAKEHAIPALIEAVAPTWPFTPQAWTTAGTGTEGTLLAIQAASVENRVVAIERITSPRLLDICATLQLKLVEVECDEQGPLPLSLRQALQARPSAFVYQPRAQIPLGHALSARRAEELADELHASPATCVVEDDFIGLLGRTVAASLGGLLPERTLLVRGYCNAYGIDLRTCVIGGASRLIDRLRAHRSGGAAMNSRILQGALAYLIGDAATQTVLRHARERYAARRVALTEALRARGLEAASRDGLSIWLSVPKEDAAIIGLASHGISVGGGSRCHVGAKTGEYLRLDTAKLPDDPLAIARIADIFAAVVKREMEKIELADKPS